MQGLTPSKGIEVVRDKSELKQCQETDKRTDVKTAFLHKIPRSLKKLKGLVLRTHLWQSYARCPLESTSENKVFYIGKVSNWKHLIIH